MLFDIRISLSGVFLPGASVPCAVMFPAARSQKLAFCFSFNHSTDPMAFPSAESHFSTRLVKYFSEDMFDFLRVIENFKAHVFRY